MAAVNKENICKECPAPCCRDLSIAIKKPRTRDDVELVKWYLMYDIAKVYVRDYRWALLIKGKCMYLNHKNLCRIYPQRPSTCRTHRPPDCEHFGEFYDDLISTPHELDKYLTKEKRMRKKRTCQRR